MVIHQFTTAYPPANVQPVCCKPSQLAASRTTSQRTGYVRNIAKLSNTDLKTGKTYFVSFTLLFPTLAMVDKLAAWMLAVDNWLVKSRSKSLSCSSILNTLLWQLRFSWNPSVLQLVAAGVRLLGCWLSNNRVSTDNRSNFEFRLPQTCDF